MHSKANTVVDPMFAITDLFHKVLHEVAMMLDLLIAAECANLERTERVG